MKIMYNDMCRCGQAANWHTVGVFWLHATDRDKREATLEDVWKGTASSRRYFCGKFIPADNLKYLEYKFEETEK